MYCSKCGSKIDEGSAFCSSCGQPNAGTASPDTQEQMSIHPAKRLSKKLIAILSGVVVVIAVICVVAFAHHAQENQIVGYWIDNQNISNCFVFYNNNEFFTDGGKGTYELSGNTITLKISKFTEKYNYSIENGVLTFHKNSDTFTFEKMTPEQTAEYKRQYKLK